MPLMAIPVGIAAWKLAALAGAGLAVLFLASPQGRETTREAARVAAEALEKLRPAPDPNPDPKRRPRPPPPFIQRCPDSEDNCEKEMCPVCGQLPNPTPTIVPSYVRDDRVPTDAETLPPLNIYKRISKRVKGATVYERPDKSLVHRDTLHRGKAAEIEVYDRRGNHTGTICPHCGAPRGDPVPGRRI